MQTQREMAPLVQNWRPSWPLLNWLGNQLASRQGPNGPVQTVAGQLIAIHTTRPVVPPRIIIMGVVIFNSLTVTTIVLLRVLYMAMIDMYRTLSKSLRARVNR